MKHAPEDDLVLHYYGEAEAMTASHLEACPECRARFETLARTLGRVGDDVPEPAPDYEARLWERLRPSLPVSSLRRPRAWRRAWRIVAFPAGLAASLVVAFLLGRHTSPLPESTPVRERILLVAVGDHLERSEVLLLEVLNADNPGDAREAEELLSENRLYRQAALRTGDAGVAGVLDELERVLVEVASAPEAGREMEELRRRIESRGLVLKIRKIGSRLRDEGRARPGPARREGKES